ncbi:MAG: ATP-grasp domain-containing protein [Oscillospiraceae bacterium]|nr:ATP-grasp domain-containing protein [Oscillospiraceae bacterium]
MVQKKYKGISVLIFGTDGRQALPVIKGFAQVGCKVTVFGASKLDPGFVTRYTTSRILYQKVKKEGESFNDCGERLIRENHFDLVVPLRDRTAIFLSERKQELSSYAKIAVNDWDVMRYASDKALTMSACEELGIPAPKTVFGDRILEQVDQKGFQYPLVVKPRTAGGSVGFNIFKSREKLAEYLESYDNANGPLLCQEYIEQKDAPQYRADFFRDRDGKFKAALVGKNLRWYPLDGGFGVFSTTILDDEILQMGKKLLDRIGWNGYANIDMVWDINENRAKILEINGRTGASIMLDYVAGVNMSQLILENELGYEVSDFTAYQPDKKIACFYLDVLWFLKSKDRFRAKPSWFHRIGVKDIIISWSDPVPAVAYLLQSMMNYRMVSEKRKRIE